MGILVSTASRETRIDFDLFEQHLLNSKVELGILIGNEYDYFGFISNDFFQNEEADLFLSKISSDDEIGFKWKREFVAGLHLARSFKMDELSREYCVYLGSKYLEKINDIVEKYSKINKPVLTMIDNSLLQIINSNLNIVSIRNKSYEFKQRCFHGIVLDDDDQIKLFKRNFENGMRSCQNIIISYCPYSYEYDEDFEVSGKKYEFSNFPEELMKYCTNISSNTMIFHINEGMDFTLYIEGKKEKYNIEYKSKYLLVK